MGNELTTLYRQEYRKGVKKILKEYINRLEKCWPGIWQIGTYTVSEIILENYWSRNCGWENYYVNYRQGGGKEEEVWERFIKCLAEYPVPEKNVVLPIDIKEHMWYGSLSVFGGGKLYYLTQEGQLTTVRPFIPEQGENIVLLTEFEVRDGIDLPDTVVVITAELTDNGRFMNVFLESNYPLLFHYCTMFDVLVNILQPKEIMVMEEGDFRNELLTVVAGTCGIALKSLGV